MIITTLLIQDGRVRDLAQLFQTKTIKVIEDTTKKLRIVEHLQVENLRLFNVKLTCWVAGVGSGGGVPRALAGL